LHISSSRQKQGKKDAREGRNFQDVGRKGSRKEARKTRGEKKGRKGEREKGRKGEREGKGNNGKRNNVMSAVSPEQSSSFISLRVLFFLLLFPSSRYRSRIA